MAVDPLRSCIYPGCNKLLQEGNYCKNHKSKRAYYKNRSSCERGYDRRWSKIRKQILTEAPYCIVCHGIANTVHHVPDYIEGTNHEDYALYPVCNGCHNRIHKARNK